MLAHAGGAPEFASSMLVAGAVIAAWIGLSRLRRRGSRHVPRWGALVLLMAPVALVASFVVPSRLWPTGTGPRLASTATISFVEPSPGERVGGPVLDVTVALRGGRVVAAATTNVTPDTGHIHLFVDGAMVSMTYGLDQEVPIGGLDPGVHRLQAEFVAANHAPFDPRVVSTVTFVKEPG
jgi:hypothetical protein